MLGSDVGERFLNGWDGGLNFQSTVIQLAISTSTNYKQPSWNWSPLFSMTLPIYSNHCLVDMDNFDSHFPVQPTAINTPSFEF